MQIDPDLQKQLVEAFIVEARERLQALNDAVLGLEAGAEGEQGVRLVEEAFRQTHSLKGAARAVSLERFERIAHDLEAFFGELRGEQPPESDGFDAVFAEVDALHGMVEELASGETALAGAAPTSKTPVGKAVDADEGFAGFPSAGVRPTVRVDVEKLDVLMAEAGELAVTSNTAGVRVEQARSAVESLAAWEAWWRSAERLIRRPTTVERRPVAPEREREQGAPSSASGRLGAGYDQAFAQFVEENERRAAAAKAVLSELVRALEADTRASARICERITDEVRRTRMLPVSSVLQSLPRMVRDLAAERGKQITLEVVGGETEVDRSVLEQLGAPLTQMVRNAIDHGVERPDSRVAAGKDPGARIDVRITQEGGSVLIAVSDDGRGIDVERLREVVLAQDALGPEDADGLTSDDLTDLIFRSGISTSPAVTSLSGRGVGLDVVREMVERLSGDVAVESESGKGTTFSLWLPLSVATVHSILVRASGTVYALPTRSVVRVVDVKPEDVGRVGRGLALRSGPQPVGLYDLAATLSEASGDQTPLPQAGRMAVVVEAGGAGAFFVDEVLTPTEVVVQPLPAPLAGTPAASGGAVIGTGEMAVLLNLAHLVRTAESSTGASRFGIEDAPGLPPLVVVADDSFATRTMEKSLLEAAGYRVVTAADGEEAWDIISSAGCDLLVSDVMMPKLNGFELTERVRSSDAFRHLPIVLVTSLDSREDRERGAAAGADAFIVKGGFDRETLLATIRRLL